MPFSTLGTNRSRFVHVFTWTTNVTAPLETGVRNRHDEKSQVDVCNRFPTIDLLYDHARSEAKKGRRGTIYDKHVTKDLRYRVLIFAEPLPFSSFERISSASLIRYAGLSHAVSTLAFRIRIVFVVGNSLLYCILC